MSWLNFRICSLTSCAYSSDSIKHLCLHLGANPKYFKSRSGEKYSLAIRNSLLGGPQVASGATIGFLFYKYFRPLQNNMFIMFKKNASFT